MLLFLPQSIAQGRQANKRERAGQNHSLCFGELFYIMAVISSSNSKKRTNKEAEDQKTT